jgi:hypothetical protein
MRERRTYGSVRGACDETHVPTATACNRASGLLRCMSPLMGWPGRAQRLVCGPRGVGFLWNLLRPPSEEESSTARASSLVMAWRFGFDDQPCKSEDRAISTTWCRCTDSRWGQMVRGYRRCRRWNDAVAGMVFIGFGMKLALSGR